MRKTVYLVVQDLDPETRLELCVFTTKQKANKYLEQQKRKRTIIIIDLPLDPDGDTNER